MLSKHWDVLFAEEERYSLFSSLKSGIMTAYLDRNRLTEWEWEVMNEEGNCNKSTVAQPTFQ